MPVVVAFAPPDVFAIRASGDVTYAECQRTIDDVLAYPASAGGRKILVDARGVVGAPSTVELRALARDMKMLIDRGYGPIAVVSDRTFMYGVARMFAVFAEAFGMRVQAFRELDEAGDWLKDA